MRKKIFLYRCTSTVSALNYCSIIFSKPLAIYTKWCAQAFPPIFGLFAIFDRNLAKIVAPPSDEYENYVACLKVQSLPKKTTQTASKSAYKRQRIACPNYAPLERTALRTRSVTKKNKNKKQKTPHFRTYSRRALYDLPQILHGDRARRAHHKRCPHFSIQRIVFPTGCTE